MMIEQIVSAYVFITERCIQLICEPFICPYVYNRIHKSKGVKFYSNQKSEL